MGFIGSAPFAWGLLSDQLASGAFVRGLWNFFGIVIAAGIFTGISGLGIGYVIGTLWEQIHRHRRRERSMAQASREASSAPTVGSSREEEIQPKTSRLRLIGNEEVDDAREN